MTGQLGTVQSYLANIELATPGTSNDTGNLSDTITLSDTFSNNHVSNVTFSDTLTFSEACGANSQTFFTSRLGTAFSVLEYMVLGLSGSLDPGLSDTITFSDSFTVDHDIAVVSFTDTITFSETLTHADTQDLTLSDTLTFSDCFPALMDDPLTLTDTFTATHLTFTGWNDTVTFSEATTENHTSNEMYGDNMTIIDHFTFNKVKLLNWSDTVTFSDSISGYLVEVLTDTMTFSDSLTYYKAHNLVPDIMTFGDFFKLNQTTYWSMTDQLVLYESNPPFTLGMYYQIQLNDTLTLVDEFVGNAIHPIDDTVTFSESLVGVASDLFSDTITFTETAKANYVHNVPPTQDFVTFTDNISTTLVNNVSLADGITFTDRGQIAYIWHGSSTDTMSFSEILVREIFEIIIDDSLAFTDTLTHSKKGQGDAADQLVFTDTMSIKAITNHNPDVFLVFNDGFAVRVKGTYNGNPGIFPSPPLTGSPVYQPPSIPVGVSNIARAVTLTGVGTTIVLPPPEFNDYIANQSKSIVQRSMTGVFRTYVKKTARDKVNWRFIIPKYKRDELYAFVLAEVDKPITAVDWEGNVWNFQLLSDTVEFAETGRWGGPILGGDRNEVTLEFTGVKYA